MRKIYLLLLMGLLFAFQSWAQNRISGKVTDKDGSPLAGVTITIKSTKTASVTGPDGTYAITVPAKSTLVFSSVGYQTVEVAANTNLMDVSMTPTNNSLSEVVEVGYGSRPKKDITGS